MNDIYTILARLEAIQEGSTTPTKLSKDLNPQQKAVPQLPALFKPNKISVLGAKTDPDHPMRGYAVGASESAETEVEEDWRSAAAAGALAAANLLGTPAQATEPVKPITVAQVTIDGETRSYNLGDRFKSSKEAEEFISSVLDKQGLSGYSIDIRTGYPKDNKQKTNEQPKTGIMSLSTPSQVPDKYALDPGEQLGSRVTGQFKPSTSQSFPTYQDLITQKVKSDTVSKPSPGMQEQIIAAEDMLGKIRRDLADYLRSVEDELVGRDRSLIRKAKQELAKPDIEKFLPVKVISTDDGKELRIHGNEDDGFRITMQEKMLPTAFESVEEASMACEMYCARRRGLGQDVNADYVEERGTNRS